MFPQVAHRKCIHLCGILILFFKKQSLGIMPILVFKGIISTTILWHWPFNTSHTKFVSEWKKIKIYLIFGFLRFIYIAGHYRTNPWSAVPDWRRCRNADYGLRRQINGKTNDAGLTFRAAFRYSGIYLVNIVKNFVDEPTFSRKKCVRLSHWTLL
jgi:hypothetical protein